MGSSARKEEAPLPSSVRERSEMGAGARRHECNVCLCVSCRKALRVEMGSFGMRATKKRFVRLRKRMRRKCRKSDEGRFLQTDAERREGPIGSSLEVPQNNRPAGSHDEAKKATAKVCVCVRCRCSCSCSCSCCCDGKFWSHFGRSVKSAAASPMDDVHVAVAGSWGGFLACLPVSPVGPGADLVLSKQTLQFAMAVVLDLFALDQDIYRLDWTISLLFHLAVPAIDVGMKDSRHHVQSSRERIPSWTEPGCFLSAIPSKLFCLSLALPTNSLPQYHDPPSPKTPTSIDAAAM